VNFTLELHHTPDDVLRLVKPVAQGAHTRGAGVQQQHRYLCTAVRRDARLLHTGIFESIDLLLPREDRGRINMEQHCLAREIVNLVACEGEDRVERHELFGKWKARLTMAGFGTPPSKRCCRATRPTN
jgi:hypothetical protein